MSNAKPAATQHPAKLPIDATFMWRNGQWHMQKQAALALLPVPENAAFILEQLKAAGRLEELAPGLFKLAGRLTSPLQDNAESPLTRLAQMKRPNGQAVLDSEQIRAGERIRHDYERAHLAPRVTSSYGASESNAGQQNRFSDNHISALTDNALDARKNLHLALSAVGPELSGILLQVCCMSAGLEQAELRLSLPRRAGKAVLELALTRLARHYGYKQSVSHAGPKHIGHWAVPDFKPKFPTQPQHQP